MFGLFQKSGKSKASEEPAQRDQYEIEKSRLPEGLRIFFSHDYSRDDRNVTEIVNRVKGFASLDEDNTVYSDNLLKGPRGGILADLTLKKKLARRIENSDIVMCPNSKAIAKNQWITWEIELGAIGFGKPVLFVDTTLHKRQNAGLLKKLQDAGCRAEKCGNDSIQIMSAINKLCGPEATGDTSVVS